MSPLRLTFACSSYDRVIALRTGDVAPQGIDLDFVALENPRETFDRMGWNAEFDLAEFSSSEFISRTARGDRTFVALPVFPSRVFRHSFIFVNRRSGIDGPEDLAGKRIGMGLYTQTAGVWIRGHLAEEYGVDLRSVRWVQGAVTQPGPHGHPNAPAPPPGVLLEQNATGRPLEELLASGDIDALIGTRVPAAYGSDPDIVRLFPDYRQVEKDFYRRTGIHPIMHLVALRRDTYEANPWIAESLFGAFVAARDQALANLRFEAAPRYMLPWLQGDIEEMDAVFGDQPWPYGVPANRPTLEALVRHMADQGLIEAAMPVDSLFLPVGGDPSVGPPAPPS